MSDPSEYKYWAFISYSHADNKQQGRKWADWLHGKLEKFRIPPEVIETLRESERAIPERLTPVFQDEKELPASADLGNQIEHALKASRNLVVICSPRSSRSLWVNQEVLRFKQLGRAQKIFPLIIAGEPNASEPEKTAYEASEECFCEALRYEVNQEGQVERSRRTEPLAADVRLDDGGEARTDDKTHHERLEREMLRIVAAILGVGFDDLVQRERNRQIEEAHRRAQRNLLLATVFGVLAVFALIAGGFALVKKKAAEDAEHEAQVQRNEAVYQAGQAVEQKKEAVYQSILATEQKEEAVRLKGVAESHQRALQRRLSVEWKGNGLRAWDAGELGEAIRWFAEALAVEESMGNEEGAEDPIEEGAAPGKVNRQRLKALLGAHSQLGSVQLSQGPYAWLAFSADETRMMTRSDSSGIQLWDVGTREPLGDPIVASGLVEGAFSESGRWLVAVEERDRIRVHRSEDGKAAGPWIEATDTIKDWRVLDDTGEVSLLLANGHLVFRDLESGDESRPAIQFSEAVRFGSFSGTRLFLWLEGGKVGFRNAETGDSVGDPELIIDQLSEFSWSANGEFGFASRDWETAYLWNASTGDLLLGPEPGRGAEFDSSGNFFKLDQSAADGQSLLTRVWKVPSLEQVLGPIESRIEPGKFPRSQFSRNGEHLTITSGDSQEPDAEESWDLGSGEKRVPPRPHRSEKLPWKFNGNGNIAVTLLDEMTLGVWNLELPDGAPLEISESDPLMDFAISENGERVAGHFHGSGLPPGMAGGQRGENWGPGKFSHWKTWKFDGEDELLFPAGEIAMGVYEAGGLTFGPGADQVLLEASEPHANPHYSPLGTWIWDANQGALLSTLNLPELVSHGEGLLQHPDKKIIDAVVADDGTRVFVVFEDHHVGSYRRDPAGFVLEHDAPLGGETLPSPPSLYGNGLALVTGETGIQVWRIVGGAAVSPVIPITGDFHHAALSPDGERVLIDNFEEGIRLLSSIDGSAVGNIIATTGLHVAFEAFGPKMNQLLTISRIGSNPPYAGVELWSIPGGTPVGDPHEYSERIFHGAFDTTGERFVVSSQSAGARVFETALGKALLSPLNVAGGVETSFFSPDGKYLVTGGAGGALRIWEARTGAPLTPELSHGEFALSVAFSPDSELVVSSNRYESASCQIWERATGQRFGPVHGGERFIGFGGIEDATVLFTLDPEQGILHHRDLEAIDGGADFWIAWGKLLSGTTVSPSGVEMPLPPDQAVAAWKRVRAGIAP